MALCYCGRYGALFREIGVGRDAGELAPCASWFRNPAISLLVPSMSAAHNPETASGLVWFSRVAGMQFCPCCSSLRLLSSMIRGR